MTDDIFSDLNDKQIQAVTATEGYIRVIAGAGAGKTRTLTRRFAYLVSELGISPRNILCVTFTNKAAGEMRARIKKTLGEGGDAALIATYHGFCVKVLKEDINRLFYPDNFQILDEHAQKNIIDEIYREFDLKLDYASIENTQKYILAEKAHLKYIPMMTDPAYSFADFKAVSLEERVYIKYLEKQKKIWGLDFNDLMYFVLYLFEHNDDILDKWKKRLHYIQVDEFQDSSKKELDLINFLCPGNNNLFVVGDPDQNIYEWRYSDNRFLVNFDKNYNDVKTIFLNQNYRSSPEILAASNSLIEKNQNRVKKELFTKNPSGAVPVHAHFKTDGEMAEWITGKIDEIALRSGNADGKNYKDIAILYRSSSVSRFVEQTLHSAGIPYVVQGGVNFYSRHEIKDALAYLRLAASDDDDAFLRIVNMPRRNIGRSKIELLKKARERSSVAQSLMETLAHMLDESDIFERTGAAGFIALIREFRAIIEEDKTAVSQILDRLLEKSGYKAYIAKSGDMERFDNIAELLTAITEFESREGEDVTVRSYLRELAVMSDYESDRAKNSVRMMTVHSAKGLEFPYVITAGMTDGVFPSRRTLEERKLEGLEEERRLCYVAMTRAMRELYFVESEGTSQGGTRNTPSRFLYDIDRSLVTEVGKVPDDIVKDLMAKAKQFDAGISAGTDVSGETLTIGSHVTHKVFGKGEIVGIDEKSDAFLIKFGAEGNPKPISRSYKGLTAGDTSADAEVPAIHVPTASVDDVNVNDADSTLSAVSDTPLYETQNIMPATILDTPLFETQNPITVTSVEEAVESVEDTIIPIIQVPEITFEHPADKDETVAVTPPNNAADEIPAPSRPSNFNRKIDRLIAERKQSEAVSMYEDKSETASNKSLQIPNQTPPPEAAPKPKSKPSVSSLRGAPPEILYDNFDRSNLWEDPSVPKSGWQNADVIDLGKVAGICGMCGRQEIRYVHIMTHKDHPSIGAGCECAAKMEGDPEASYARENELKNRLNRLETFNHIETKTSAKGNQYFKYKGTNITFIPSKFGNDKWAFIESDSRSDYYSSLDEAKNAAFAKIDGRLRGG
ncbi:hypothetical protein FACS1894105_08440 [Clostridia bacterium]|nr:hypothetical protein FACS1894105_08440 [Clostridia bacterium]